MTYLPPQRVCYQTGIINNRQTEETVAILRIYSYGKSKPSPYRFGTTIIEHCELRSCDDQVSIGVSAAVTKRVSYFIVGRVSACNHCNNSLTNGCFTHKKYICTIVGRCIWQIYYPRPRSEEVCSRYIPSRRRGVNLTANFRRPRSRVV